VVRHVGVVVVFLLLAAVAMAEPPTSNCWYPDSSPSATFGKDEQGYFIKLTAPAHYPYFGGGRIWSLLDYFAAESGATVYGGSFVDMMRATTFRGKEPLETLRAFLRAGGRDIQVASEDLWLVTRVDKPWSIPVSIVVYPFDSSQARWLEPQQGGSFATDLVRQLPVRSDAMQLADDSLRNDVGYYWLPEEPNTLLVTMFGFHEMMKPAAVFRVMKVRAEERAGRYDFTCVWTVERSGERDAAGPLLHAIAEDFDGDGVRDFVFDTFDVMAHDATIISGQDGHVLAHFASLVFSVSKRESGPKYIAVGEYNDVGREDPSVLVLSEDHARFEAAQGLGTTPKAVSLEPDATGQRIFDTALARLTRIVGGAENVRVYRFPEARRTFGWDTSHPGYDIVFVPKSNWLPELLETAKAMGIPWREALSYRPEPVGKAQDESR
jgi:hypothetical protein